MQLQRHALVAEEVSVRNHGTERNTGDMERHWRHWRHGAVLTNSDIYDFEPSSSAVVYAHFTPLPNRILNLLRPPKGKSKASVLQQSRLGVSIRKRPASFIYSIGIQPFPQQMAADSH